MEVDLNEKHIIHQDAAGGCFTLKNSKIIEYNTDKNQNK